MTRLAAVGLILACAGLVDADLAVVVGVQVYAPLASANTLRGCVNDARAMKALLVRKGFQVVILENERATRKGILDALAQAAKSNKPSERFVFYFAGHGRSTPRLAMMPHDATNPLPPKNDTNDITPPVLNRAVAAIPAASRTIILDCCFSGGAAYGELTKDIGDDLTARFYDGSKDILDFDPDAPAPANAQDSPAKLAGDSGICYYAACLGNQESLEGTFDGERHGLFTNSLLGSMDDTNSWADVRREVNKKMEAKLANKGRDQNPVISTEYLPATPFGTVPSTAPPAKSPASLLDLWAYAMPDPAKVSLRITPDDTKYEVGRRLQVTFQTGQDGYLVVLGKSPAGRYYKVWPLGNTSEPTPAGSVQYPPRGSVTFFDEFGADQLKAYLFASAEEARAVLDAVTATGRSSMTLDDLSKEIEAPERAGKTYTSTLAVTVIPTLLDGQPLKDLDGLYHRILTATDDVSRYLRERLGRALSAKHRQWLATAGDIATPSDTDRGYFLALLNAAMQREVLYDARAFAGVKLRTSTASLLAAPASGANMVKLNRMLLADAFPTLVAPDRPKGSKDGR